MESITKFRSQIVSVTIGVKVAGMLDSRVAETTPPASRKIKLSLMGPAFIAAIGYIDPGNFAPNIQAGASYGYKLLWVVVWANFMAMLIQLLSAKLGIATGKNLAEHIRDRVPRPAVCAYWVQAEIIAIATDLAECIGAAIGFKLLLRCTLLEGAVLTGIATFLILTLQRRGQKPLELVIGACCFLLLRPILWSWYFLSQALLSSRTECWFRIYPLTKRYFWQPVC